MKQKLWTPSEDSLFEQLMQERKSAPEIARVLKRSITGIRIRRYRLEIPLPDGVSEGTWLDGTMGPRRKPGRKTAGCESEDGRRLPRKWKRTEAAYSTEPVELLTFKWSEDLKLGEW